MSTARESHDGNDVAGAPRLTPSILGAMLRDAGALAHGDVTSVEISQRLTTTVSHLCFATVAYGEPVPRLPRRVLVKWPLDSMAAAGLAERKFYQDLAPLLPVPPIVRCVATAPESGGELWVIVEDLRATHTNPAWPDPPTRSQAEGAVTALAEVHARWWEAASLGRGVGELHSHESLRTMVLEIAGHLPAFLEALGDALPAADARLLERVFGSSLAPWLRLVDSKALTIVHGDAHTWNFLFPRSGDGLPYLIDWQLWHVDVGVRDLAFLIALHWDSALRRDWERPLLELYHGRLAAAGVSDYAFNELWLDYRRCVVRNLTFPIILWRRGLPREAWRRRLDCALAAVRDLEADELL